MCVNQREQRRPGRAEQSSTFSCAAGATACSRGAAGRSCNRAACAHGRWRRQTFTILVGRAFFLRTSADASSSLCLKWLKCLESAKQIVLSAQGSRWPRPSSLPR